jgi:hypothetical protein
MRLVLLIFSNPKRVRFGWSAAQMMLTGYVVKQKRLFE